MQQRDIEVRRTKSKRRQPAPKPALRCKVRVPMTVGPQRSVPVDWITFDGLTAGKEHFALCVGDFSGTRLVRMQSECMSGDLFGSERCDCGGQLREALARISESGGVLIYRRQEGRGIGLYNKLDAYALQDQGLDTYAANTALGLPEDARDYTAAAQMLTALGIGELDLLSNNPDKAGQLRELGIDVRDRVPTGVFATPDNVRYLRAKVLQTQHTLPLGDLAGLSVG